MDGLFCGRQCSAIRIREDLTKPTYSNPNFVSPDLSKWDVSRVTTMRYMFSYAPDFNSDLSEWDVSKVTSMSHTFYQCTTFKSDVSKWKTTNLADLLWVFHSAREFDSDISKWDVSKVTQFSQAFKVAKSFDSDISQWDVSSGTRFDEMFLHASKFQQVWCTEIWQNSGITTGDFKSTDGAMMFCCKPGEYSSDPSLFWSGCTSCPSGNYSSSYNMDTSCPACPLDHIAPTEGLNSCAKCVNPRYSNNGITCDICETGKVTDQSDSTFTSCRPCDGGTFQTSPGSVTCIDCPFGWHQNESSKQFCLPCLPGEYNNEKSQTLCKKCPNGFFTAIAHAVKCDPTGRFSMLEFFWSTKFLLLHS